ncbi:hypothetical protein GQ42DRAFT_103721, partial [Ramicandelaber brevisporus]
MVQGGVKKSKAPAKRADHAQPKRGRVIAPKNTALKQKKQLEKRLTATINRDIERQMATKAGSVGKLTIMKSAMDKEGAQDAKKKK